MNPPAKHNGGTSVAIIGRIVDDLGIHCEVKMLDNQDIIEGLDDPLVGWMRQLAVANQDAEPALGQIGLVDGR